MKFGENKRILFLHFKSRYEILQFSDFNTSRILGCSLTFIKINSDQYYQCRCCISQKSLRYRSRSILKKYLLYVCLKYKYLRKQNDASREMLSVQVLQIEDMSKGLVLSQTEIILNFQCQTRTQKHTHWCENYNLSHIIDSLNF